MPLTETDRGEILQLAGRYAQSLDTNDSDGWADCFTRDGAYESDLQGRFAGREELIRFAGICKELMERTGMQPRHWTNHWVINGDGETVRATSYVMVLDTAHGSAVVAAGVYRDQLRKMDGSWKFVERVFVMDGPMTEEMKGIGDLFKGAS